MLAANLHDRMTFSVTDEEIAAARIGYFASREYLERDGRVMKYVYTGPVLRYPHIEVMHPNPSTALKIGRTCVTAAYDKYPEEWGGLPRSRLGEIVTTAGTIWFACTTTTVLLLDMIAVAYRTIAPLFW